MTVIKTFNGKIRLVGGRFAEGAGEVNATSPDTEPPTIPGGVTSSNESSEGASATWDPSSDNIGVNGYEYRLNGGAATDNGPGTSLSLYSLVSATSYSLQIRAYDAAGNRSGWSEAAEFITLSTGSSTTYSVLMLYGDVSRDGYIPSSTSPSFPTPYHQMRFNDTGDDGFSEFAAVLTGSADASGNWYSVSESYDVDFDTTTDLSGIDILFLCSSQRTWSTSQEADIVSAVSGGMGLLFLSDSALGGEWWRVGKHNTVGQGARNPLIENFGMQVYVDQASGIRTQTLGVSSSLAQGSSRQFRGEGVSPIRIDAAASGVWAKGSPRKLHGFTKSDGTADDPGRDQNITYTGDICSLAAAYYGDGVVIGVFDRNGFWNDGAGSNITEVDNSFVYRSLFEHMAGTIPKPDDFPLV